MLSQILRELRKLNTQLAFTNDMLKAMRMRMPDGPRLRVLGEKDGKMRFVLELPPPVAIDMGSRELTVAVGLADPAVLTLTGTATVSEELVGERGDEVTGQLVDIDTSGNRSPARDFSLIIIDNVPPPQPGEIGIRVIGE